jgi:RimJ/RimL family protein N-acetyltransferase
MKVLETRDIRLIPLAAEHEHDFVRLANVPEINRRVNKPPLYTNTHFSEQLANVQKAKAHYVWMIEHNGIIVGVINNAAGRHPHVFQGGYWVDPAYWGKGAASSALTLVKDFVLEECNAQRVQAVVEPDNTASIRVLEKCGYQREGLLRKFYPSAGRGLIDVLMYSVVR